MYYNVIATGDENCVIINDVMIDCGAPFGKIKGYLHKVNYLLLTHIHKDHINKQTLDTIRYCFPHITVIGNETVHHHYKVDKMAGGFGVVTEDYRFTCFELKHDIQNTGYAWRYGDIDIIYATDTGDLDNAPNNLYDFMFLESNYDIHKLAEAQAYAAQYGRAPFVKFQWHLSKQEAWSFYQNHKKNSSSKLIELHKSDAFYDGSTPFFTQ